MQIQLAYRNLRNGLQPLYGERESSVIASMVVEKLTGFSRAALLTRNDMQLTDPQQMRYTQWYQELLEWRPVQYVLGEAWFAGMRFQVDERVLIPRPETEELVDWIADQSMNNPANPASQARVNVAADHTTPKILDIGTGSGCIAIALKKKLPRARIWAMDQSAAALELARENGRILGTEIEWIEGDILQPAALDSLPILDIIVSNPPYVPRSDEHAMRNNVRNYEPALALYVEDADPLLFYRTIAAAGLKALRSGGQLFFEIHFTAGKAITHLLTQAGYADVQLRQDLSGLDRMVSAMRP